MYITYTLMLYLLVKKLKAKRLRLKADKFNNPLSF